MINSAPLSVLELGISHQEYKDIARNIPRVRLISLEGRQRIRDMAGRGLLPEVMLGIPELVEKMACDKRVYLLAGLDYADGPPEGEDLFSTAVVDYLLRNRPDFCRKTL